MTDFTKIVIIVIIIISTTTTMIMILFGSIMNNVAGLPCFFYAWFLLLLGQNVRNKLN